MAFFISLSANSLIYRVASARGFIEMDGIVLFGAVVQQFEQVAALRRAHGRDGEVVKAPHVLVLNDWIDRWREQRGLAVQAALEDVGHAAQCGRADRHGARACSFQALWRVLARQRQLVFTADGRGARLACARALL